jgi:hypothetical protein
MVDFRQAHPSTNRASFELPKRRSRVSFRRLSRTSRRQSCPVPLGLRRRNYPPCSRSQLTGSVNFNFNTSMTDVQRRVVTGTIVGKPSRPVQTAAFVVVAKQADIKDLHTGANFERGGWRFPLFLSSPIVAAPSSGRRHQWHNRMPAPALEFRLADQHLLLVKWTSDFCGSVYSVLAGRLAQCDRRQRLRLRSLTGI